MGGATLRARGRAERVLAEVLDEEELVGKIDWRAEVGATAERIAAVAEEERAALIVLGSRPPNTGAGRHSRLATEIAKMTPVPVALPAEGRIVTGGRKLDRHGDRCASNNGGLDPDAVEEPTEEAA